MVRVFGKLKRCRIQIWENINSSALSIHNLFWNGALSSISKAELDRGCTLLSLGHIVTLG